METIEELKVHYRWDEEDEENLRKIAWLGESYAEEFMSPEKVQELITLSLITLSLGVVFWLIYKVEAKS